MIIEYLLKSALILTIMSMDNIFWISASPEYEAFKRLPFLFDNKNNSLILYNKKYTTKISYIFNYRIKTVWTNYRDIIPALIGGLILTILT